MDFQKKKKQYCESILKTYGNDDVNVVLAVKGLDDLLGKGLTHGETGLVYGNTVDDAVLAGKVDVLKDTGSDGLGGGQLAARHLLAGDNDSLAYNRESSAKKLECFGWNVMVLTRVDVLIVREAQSIESDALRSKHVIVAAVRRRTATEHQRTDTVRVAETNNAKTSNHGHTRVRTTTLLVEVLDGGEDILLVHTKVAYRKHLSFVF